MSHVHLTQSSDSYKGTVQTLTPFIPQLKKELKNKDYIVIKINFVTTKNELATTPFESVKAFIDTIQTFYKGKVIIAEQASIGDTNQGFETFGFTKLAKSNFRVEIINTSNDTTTEVKAQYPHGILVLPISNTFYKSPFTVSIGRAKTHDSVIVTLSIKNLLVGAIQGGIPVRSKIHKGKNIHWILQSLAEHVYPDFSIIDGVVGMQGQGPVDGDPIQSNFLAASFDSLALDSVVSHIMGFQIKDIGYFILLSKKQTGILYPNDTIKLTGENLKIFQKKYQPHPNFEQQKKWKR